MEWMGKNITRQEAEAAADALLKEYDRIERECFKREMDSIVAIEID